MHDSWSNYLWIRNENIKCRHLIFFHGIFVKFPNWNRIVIFSFMYRHYHRAEVCAKFSRLYFCQISKLENQNHWKGIMFFSFTDITTELRFGKVQQTLSFVDVLEIDPNHSFIYSCFIKLLFLSHWNLRILVSIFWPKKIHVLKCGLKPNYFKKQRSLWSFLLT